MPSLSKTIVSVALLVWVSACTKKEPAPFVQDEPQAKSQQDMVARGRMIYNSACTACHNINPKADGALGPAVFGSSKELIEHRVMKGDYPPGYTPKRTTKVMVALPHLHQELEFLHAYLNSSP